MAAAAALATPALYPVLKSNGLPRPKIRLKKFGFSLKTVPANIAKKLPPQVLSQIVFHPVFQLLAQMAHVCLHSESGYTLGFRRKIAHNGSHGETRGVSDGGGITTLGPFRTFTNIPGPGIRTAYFASFGAWSGVLPKNAGSLGTAMRLCVSLFRGVAAPLGCVIFFQFCRNCDLYAMRACARHGRYHYPQRALRAAETPDGRLSKRLICRFLRSGGRSSPHDSYFLANTQNFLLAVPVANAFALWYDKFDKLELG